MEKLRVRKREIGREREMVCKRRTRKSRKKSLSNYKNSIQYVKEFNVTLRLEQSSS